MFKRIFIPVIILLSVLLFGLIVSTVAQTTTVGTNRYKQAELSSSEIKKLRTTNKLLLEYLDLLKPELHLLDKIDTTLVRNVDVTFDGKPEIISIHVTGNSILDPFKWKLEIVSEEKTLLHHESDDGWIDNYFGSNDSWISDRHGLDKSQGLNRYIQEKSYYYFNILLDRLIQRSKIDKDNTMFSRDSSGGGGIYLVFPEQLKKMGITDENKINTIIEKAIERLQTGTTTLSIFISPIQFQFPRIFVPEVNSFLVFYER